MTLAQRLYEGVELGEEGSVALITYMRTDSVHVSNDALAQVRELIARNTARAICRKSPITTNPRKMLKRRTKRSAPRM